MATQAGRVWSDLDHRLIQDSQGQLKIVENVESVMSSIHNILHTFPGERVMLSEFGSPLRGIVFENMESEELDLVSQQMQRTIEAWDDRVLVTEIEFSMDPDRSAVTLALQFQIRGYDKVFQYVTPVKGSAL